jgi:two-component system NtrC family sensor kinase
MAIRDQQPATVSSSASPPDAMTLSAEGVPVEQLRRRADLLLNCAQTLHCHLDVSAVVTTLAERVQELLAVEMVAVLLRRGDRFTLEAVATVDAELNASIQAAHADGRFQFAEDLAARSHATGEPIAIPVTAFDPQCPGFSAPGQVLAAAMRSADANGALIVYRSGVIPFNADERSVLAAVAGYGALAFANAELYARANEKSRVLQQLLAEAALELNSTLHLPEFGETFTRRAAEMLRARGAALAIAQGARFDLVTVYDPTRNYEAGERYSLSAVLSDIAAAHPEPVFTGSARELLGEAAAAMLGWSDLTLARMFAADGTLLGCLCLFDRCTPLTSGDRKLLSALISHASVALANARLFTRMDQANRHWMEIFDAITDLIVVHDENLRVLRVNRSLADFIGVMPNELIGVSMRAMIAMAADYGVEACPFCRVVSGGDEYIHPVLDRTYLVSTSRVHGATSDGMQTIHVLKDITDRREAERRYRELFDTIQEGLFFSTPEGRFIEVNEALVRMLGYECREDLLSVNITEDIYVTPDQRERFRQEIHTHGMVRNYEEVLRRRDGSLVYTLQNAFAVRDAQGEVIQYRGLILDITELKAFQAELQRQRDFNTKILDNTQSMIMVVDTAGLISYGNRRCFEAGGYTQDELLGRKLVDLVPTPRRSSLAEALSETLAGRQVDNLELPVLLGQGRGGQFSINLSPMRDEAGNVNSIVVVMTDISDAAMLQAKLMHTEKMAAVGQLVSGVAHEVNNPLTAVLGFTDLLLDNPEVPESAKNDLRVVLQEAQRTKQIVQNLLSFARQMPPERQAVQVNVVLRRTLALRSYDFANHGIQIIERLEDGVPAIMGDAHQLQQVFLNILNNAYDAVHETGRQGRIEISTGVVNGWAEVTFRDNGHGVTYTERIFDPFFTTKDVGKGTGLGLSICYGIVREHGGEILCRNNVETPGATFTVRLPVAESARAGAASGGQV